MERFDFFSPGPSASLIGQFAGSRFGICGLVPAIRLGEAIRLIAVHPHPEARFLLLEVMISAVIAKPSDRGVHEAVELIWDLIAVNDWSGVRAHVDLEGVIVGFSQEEVEPSDWEDEAFSAVMVADVAVRAQAIEAVLNNVLETYVTIERGIATTGTGADNFAIVRSNPHLAQLIANAAATKNPCCSYLVISSLVTDIAHQYDADGVALAVQYGTEIYAQSSWPQARLIRNERGVITGFDDDVYAGQGLAKAVGQAVLQQDVSDRERAAWGLIYFAVEDPPHDWGHEVASFLEKQRLHAGSGH